MPEILCSKWCHAPPFCSIDNSNLRFKLRKAVVGRLHLKSFRPPHTHTHTHTHISEECTLETNSISPFSFQTDLILQHLRASVCVVYSHKHKHTHNTHILLVTEQCRALFKLNVITARCLTSLKANQHTHTLSHLNNAHFKQIRSYSIYMQVCAWYARDRGDKVQLVLSHKSHTHKPHPHPHLHPHIQLRTVHPSNRLDLAASTCTCLQGIFAIVETKSTSFFAKFHCTQNKKNTIGLLPKRPDFSFSK